MIANAKTCTGFATRDPGGAYAYGWSEAVQVCGYVRTRWLTRGTASSPGSCPARGPQPPGGDAEFVAGLAGVAGLVDNCAPTEPGASSCNDGWEVALEPDRCAAVPFYANVQPWLDAPAPLERPVRTIAVAPGGTLLKWRYVTRDGRWVLVRDPSIVIAADQPGGEALVPWGFVPRACLPPVLDHGVGYPSFALPGRAVSDFNSDGAPDIVARDAGGLALYDGDGRGHLRAGGGRPIPNSGYFTGYRLLASVGDWNGDRVPDLLALDGQGAVSACSGSGDGGISGCRQAATGWNDVERIVGVGDWDGDGHADVVVERTGGELDFWGGDGHGGWSIRGAPIGTGWGSYDALAGVGDWNGDGHPDLLARAPGGDLWEWDGSGARPPADAFSDAGPRLIARGLAGYDLIAAGRWDADALPDLLLRAPDGTLLRFTGNLAGGWAGPGLAIASGLQRFETVLALPR